MDYEKAYKDALAWMREVYPTLSGAAKEDAEHFFPELKESEDERVRKEIIGFLQDLNKDKFPYVDFTSWLAWLEKQKDPEDIIGKAMSYFGAESLLDNANGLSDFEKFTAWLYCEFLRGLPKKLNQEYIKEQTKVILDAAQKELCKMPNSTELTEMWDAEKAMLQEKDFRGDTWRIAYNAFMDGFARGTCVKFEKQKEQKPVELSEEDEIKLKLCEDSFRVPQTRRHLIQQGLTPGDMVSWIKSPRNRPKTSDTWKPSEEQMEALKIAICYYGDSWVSKEHKNLESLYADLKNLTI